MDLFFTPAYAQTAGGGGGPDLIGFFVPLILIFGIMYFLIIRPQQKRMKEHQSMLEALRRGDEVVTAGGLLGKVTRVKEGDEEVEVEISEGVRVRVLKATISAVLSKTEVAKSGGEKSGEARKPRAGSKPAAKRAEEDEKPANSNAPTATKDKDAEKAEDEA